MNRTHSPGVGPIEAVTWPTHLTAHVVSPGDEPRIHGVDVQTDLATHYSPTDAVALALTGDVPDEHGSRALNVALMFLAPVTIAEAPVHAASLARLCGARSSGILAVAATALAEQARRLFDRCESVIANPEKFPARSDGERAATERLRRALGKFCERVPELAHDIDLDAAIIATLFACGFRTREQVEVIVTATRLPFACAEAFAWKPGDFRAYPMDLPPFEYTR